MKFKDLVKQGLRKGAEKTRQAFMRWKRDREEKKFWRTTKELKLEVPAAIVPIPAFLERLGDIAQIIGNATGDPWLNRFALEHIETYLKSERETNRFVGATAVYEVVFQDVDIVPFFPQIIRLLADENEFVYWKAKLTVKMISEGLGNPREIEDKSRDHYFLGLEIAKALQSDWVRQLADSNSPAYTHFIEVCAKVSVKLDKGGYLDDYVRMPQTIRT